MILQFQIDNERHSIDLPFHPSEVPFSDFCDFKGAENQYWEINKEADPDDPAPVTALIKAISGMVKGDIEHLPFALPDDNYQDLVDDEYQVQIGDELSILRVYAHLVVMIQTYKPDFIPETFKLKWGGKKFSVRSRVAARVLTGRGMTAGEAIEVLEYQRRAAKAAEVSPEEQGNIEFTLGLTEFAILVRRPGERLPNNRNALSRFIADRQKLFSNLPMDKVFDLRFFLLNALVKSAKTQTTGFSGTDLRAVPGQRKVKRKKPGRKWHGLRGT